MGRFELMARVEVDDAVKREEVLGPHRRARVFWEKVLQEAVTD